MKKLIDIPDEYIKELKVIAAKSDSRSLKSFIENEINSIVTNEKIIYASLSDIAVKDGQFERFTMNLLRSLFDEICEKQIFEECHWFTFKNTNQQFIVFLKCFRDCLNHSILYAEIEE